MYVTYSLSLPPVAVFGFTGGDTSYMSCALVCLDGLGFLFGNQTCYRISHKAGGELGRPL